jgi:hypothetical protein
MKYDQKALDTWPIWPCPPHPNGCLLHFCLHHRRCHSFSDHCSLCG